MVIESHCQGLGLAQVCHNTLGVTRWKERRTQGEAKIDSLLARVTLLWQMLEGAERLLEVLYGLAVGRPRQSLLPSLPAVGQGLGPDLPSQGMMRQAFGLLSYPVHGERLEGLDNP